MMKRIRLAIALLGVSLAAMAQDVSTPKTSSLPEESRAIASTTATVTTTATTSTLPSAVYALEYGYSEITDTYLSPLQFRGQGIALYGEWSHRGVGRVPNTAMTFDVRLAGALTRTASRRASLYELDLAAGWSMLWLHAFPYGLDFTLGGRVGFDAGVLYRPGGSNNPATAIADVGLSLKASLARAFTVRRLPLVLRDEVCLPTVGATFSQQYGESYYEIWLGNHAGLVHPTWWGNAFAITNLLAVDMKLGKHSLRIGYRFSLLDRKIKQINRRMTGHALVVGITL